MSLAAALTLCGLCGVARAQSSEAGDAVGADAVGADAVAEHVDEDVIDGPKDALDEDSVFKQLVGRRPFRDVLLGPGLLETFGRHWQHGNDELEARSGMRFGLAYTMLGQWAPGSDAGKQGIGGDLDFTGLWNLLGSEDEGNAGYLGFATEWRHDFGPRPPSALANEFDAFSRTTQAFNELDPSIVEFWWSQELFDDALEITAGTVNPRTFYNTNRLRNQNDTFLNQVFTGNRAIGLPGRGPGVNVAYRPEETWYVTGGIHDANGRGSGIDFGSLDDGEFAYIAELGWTPTLEPLGRGNYRLTLWHSDPSRRRGTDEGTGFALSVDQDFGEDLIGFLRYAYADGDARGAKQTLSGGLGVTGLFDREDDLIGIGLGWSDPDEDALNDEFVAEVFYRLQLTSTQQLSIGWQGYITPAFDPDDEFIGVFGVRWRIRM